MTNKEIVERMERLEEDNARLRDDLTALRASLAGEVRTRRLVVEEEDGFERVVAEGHRTFGTVRVNARPVGKDGEYAADGEDASAVLCGSDESKAATASFYVMAAGDVFARLGVTGPLPGARSKGAECSLDIDSPFGLPGITIDSEGLKNAPMRLYRERTAREA